MAQADPLAPDPDLDRIYRNATAAAEAERAKTAAYREQLMATTGVAPAAPAQDFNPEYKKILGEQEQEIQNAKAANQAEQQHAADAAKAKAPLIEGLQKEIQGQLDNPITPPTPPQFGPVPNQGQYIDQTAAKAMFAVASMMAALGMAGGRGRGMLAMAGMTGALAGFNEGNYEKYKEGMDQYKTQVEEQIAAYNMQMKDYQARMDQEGITLEQRKTLLELETIKHNDILGQDILKQQGAEGLFKYYDDMRKTVDGMAKAANQNILDPLKEKLLQAQIDKTKAQTNQIEKGGGTTGKLSTEQYKLLMARRARGETTGNPEVDALNPDDAKQLSGLVPKATAAQTKQHDQLIGMSHSLDELIDLIPQMDKAGYLPSGKGWIATKTAAVRRELNSSDPILTKWNSLSGTMVGFDRTVFADIGARIKDAYDGSIRVVREPGTAEGTKSALEGYKHQLENSPEAQRVLASEPGAFQYTPSGKAGGGSSSPGTPVTLERGTSKSGRPIWRYPGESVWHYGE